MRNSMNTNENRIHHGAIRHKYEIDNNAKADNILHDIIKTSILRLRMCVFILFIQTNS